MDFWSRLLAGGASSSPLSKKSPAPLTPEQRLQSFQAAYGLLVDKWRVAPSRPEAAGIVSLKQCLLRLTAILDEETRAAGPDLCREFAASNQIYVTISKIGASTQDDGLIGGVVTALSKFVESEEELDFLGDEVFAISFMQFVRKVVGVTSTIDISLNTETDLVELLFGIATKIRLHPHILPIWFSKAIGNEGEEISFAGVAKKEDFPLLYVLLHYIHHEGKLGDFARTGLLYVIESASFSEELEAWICESDLPTLMASGLGALYSQLSRKLYLSYDEDSLPLLAFSDDEYPPVPDSQSSESDEFKSHMKTFLSHLLFWQDVLEHCKSAEVKQSMLDHFHVLFLQQLLYPSILESSDPGGGSAVAILTYMHRILDALDHPDLVHLILHYLLALPEEPSSPKTTRRQKSMDLLTMSMSMGDSRPVNWFTLADLVLLSLKTDNQQVVISALRLVTVIIKKHHRYALNTLVKTSYEFDEESGRTVGAQDKEIDFLFSLIERIGGVDNFDELYEAYLSDAQVTVEAHVCSDALLGRNSDKKKFVNAEKRPRELYLHALWHKDTLVFRICTLLESYFTNNALVNLHLTETIINLGACGYVRLSGWLVVHYSKYLFPSAPSSKENQGRSHETDEQMLFELNRLEQIQLARRLPTWQPDALPPLLQSIHKLVTQVGHLRSEIPDFDSLLIERKQAFQISEKLSEAISSSSAQPMNMPITPQAPQKIFSPSPIRPSALGSISQLIFSPRTTPRSGSPRRKSSLVTPTPTKIRPTPSPSKPQFPSSLGRAGSPSPTRRNTGLASPRLNETNLGDVIQGFREPRKRELRRRVKFPRGNEAGESDVLPPLLLGRKRSDDEEVQSDSDDEESESDSEAYQESSHAQLVGTSSVNHVLTNVVILQHFLLELAALIQVRAATLGDVRFV